MLGPVLFDFGALLWSYAQIHAFKVTDPTQASGLQLAQGPNALRSTSLAAYSVCVNLIQDEDCLSAYQI